jgi:hypothetical protein
LALGRRKVRKRVQGAYNPEDPIGLAGGLNLYGFAGGDPINFGDPFGLCRDDDEVCKQLVEKLREVGGATLEATAGYLADYQGRVFLDPTLPGDMGQAGERAIVLGTGATMTASGLMQPGEGDLLVLAAHEVGHLLHGIGEEYSGTTAALKNLEKLLNIEKQAFEELRWRNYSAPVFYTRLKEYGVPVRFYRPPPPLGGGR